MQVNNALKYGLAEMTLRFRQRLTTHLYNQYMRGNTFYLMYVLGVYGSTEVQPRRGLPQPSPSRYLHLPPFPSTPPASPPAPTPTTASPTPTSC